VEIIPVGIIFLDQRNLPRARPLFQPFLAFDGIFGVFKLLEVNEFHDIVFLGEAFDQFQLMLADAPDEIAGHTNVERAASAAGKNVDVVTACAQLPPLEYWIARSSRAMTVFL
jgi:hypothetical protein